MLLLACLPVLLGSKDPFLYQVSAFEALRVGHYDGRYPVSDLPKHGVVGVGTFNGLNGEMIVLDGKVYQIDAYGVAKAPPPGARTPFACVCMLGAESQLVHEFKTPISRQALQAWIDRQSSGPQAMLAIRMDGNFQGLEARSFEAQMKPYKPFGEIGDRQSLLHYGNQTGTVVGFRLPPSVGTYNVPGYHFHFLTTNRKRGGHVLGFSTFTGNVRLQTLAGFLKATG